MSLSPFPRPWLEYFALGQVWHDIREREAWVVESIPNDKVLCCVYPLGQGPWEPIRHEIVTCSDEPAPVSQISAATFVAEHYLVGMVRR